MSTRIPEGISIQDAAASVGLSEKTLHRERQAGRLRMHKVRGRWRIDKTDFSAWWASTARKALS